MPKERGLCAARMAFAEVLVPFLLPLLSISEFRGPALFALAHFAHMAQGARTMLLDLDVLSTVLSMMPSSNDEKQLQDMVWFAGATGVDAMIAAHGLPVILSIFRRDGFNSLKSQLLNVLGGYFKNSSPGSLIVLEEAIVDSDSLIYIVELAKNDKDNKAIYLKLYYAVAISSLDGMRRLASAGVLRFALRHFRYSKIALDLIGCIVFSLPEYYADMIQSEFISKIAETIHSHYYPYNEMVILGWIAASSQGADRLVEVGAITPLVRRLKAGHYNPDNPVPSKIVLRILAETSAAAAKLIEEAGVDLVDLGITTGASSNVQRIFEEPFGSVLSSNRLYRWR
jgi:hypothetical protein